MKQKLMKFVREFIVGISSIILIVGIICLSIGSIWFWLSDSTKEGAMHFIQDIGNWNDYVFVLGLVLAFIGLYYLYAHHKNKKFVLEEFQTKKRSEFLKRHGEVKSKVKRLPSKYKKMLAEKEKELKIK